MQPAINYNIYKGKAFTNVKPTDTINTTKNVHSFAASNGLRNCLFKSQGGWYRLELNGILTLVVRALYLITFEELYYILKD